MPDAVCLSVGRKSKEQSKQGLINGFCHPVTLFSSSSAIMKYLWPPTRRSVNSINKESFFFFLGGRQAENTTTVADRY